MLLGYKIAGIGLITTLALAGWLGYQKITLEADYARQAVEMNNLKQLNATLEATNQQHLLTIDQLTTLTQRQADLLVEYGEQNNDAFHHASQLESQLNTLRQTESIRALEAPYARGNAATLRVGDLLRDIAGDTDSQGKDPADNP